MGKQEKDDLSEEDKGGEKRERERDTQNQDTVGKTDAKLHRDGNCR